MKIEAINNNFTAYKHQQRFGNSLPKDLSAIFALPQVPTRLKRTLWEMSEIPYFCEATQTSSKADFLKIAKLVNEAKTNVVKLALKGDIKMAPNTQGRHNLTDFLSLKNIAQFNKYKPKAQQKNLFQVIKSLPVPLEQIDKDMAKKYPDDNMYPNFLVYKTNAFIPTPKSDRKILEMDEKLIQSMVMKTNGEASDEAILFFEAPVRGKFDKVIRYYPTPSKIIEPPDYSTPYNMHIIYNAPNIGRKYKEGVFELSEIPYFTNLAQYTEPHRLCCLGAINKESENIFSKMFTKDITLSVQNPSDEVPVSFPVIDAKRLLLDLKTGVIENPDLLDMLEENTIAMPIYRAYTAFKKGYPDQKLDRMSFDCHDGKIIQKFFSDNEESTSEYSRTLTPEMPDHARLTEYLSKMPLKMLHVNM